MRCLPVLVAGVIGETVHVAVLHQDTLQRGTMGEQYSECNRTGIRRGVSVTRSTHRSRGASNDVWALVGVVAREGVGSGGRSCCKLYEQETRMGATIHNNSINTLFVGSGQI